MRCEKQFTWNDVVGVVSIECIPNDAPAAYGCWNPEAYGYPVCTARVSYPHTGYEAMFGWVQLVNSTDNTSGGQGFEPDPFALFGDAQSPYCFYGTEPTLFDAPSRDGPPPREWVAHSFLATTPVREILDGGPRRVVPVLGFSWGFDCDGSAIALRGVLPLTASDWRDDLPILEASYPAPRWTFASDADF
jgi:hypothetical protein